MKTKTYAIRLNVDLVDKLYRLKNHKELVKQSILEILCDSKEILKRCKYCNMKFKVICMIGDSCLNCNALTKDDNTITFSNLVIKELFAKKENYKKLRSKDDSLKSVKQFCLDELGISLSTLQKRARKLNLKS